MKNKPHFNTGKEGKFISVVIPAYNEEEAVSGLFLETKEVLEKLNKPFEIIFVNDGSADNTLEKLKKLRPVKVVNFRKNFGQTAALDAGIKAAQGEIIIAMDGDGQNDPTDIPALIEELEKGYDVVSGWRWQRRDPLAKRIISRGGRLLRSIFAGDNIHDSGCTLKAYRKECFDNFDLYGEIHRFIPTMLRWQGFKIGEIKVNHRSRKTGKTKYNFSRTLKGFVDILSVWFWSKYSARPLHLFGGIGVFSFVAGFFLVAYLFVMRVLGLMSFHGSIWPLVGFFLVLSGIQLFIFGLLFDIALKSYYRVHKKNPYRIKEIIENK